MNNKTHPDKTARPVRRRSRKARARRRRKIALWIVGLLAFFLISTSAVGMYYFNQWRSGAWQPSPELKETAKTVASHTALLRNLDALRDDLKALSACIERGDTEGAYAARGDMQRDLAKTKNCLSSPFWLLMQGMPGVGQGLHTAREALNILQDADAQLFDSFLAHAVRHPLNGIRGENGVRVDAVLPYLDYMEQHMAEIEPLAKRASALDLSFLDSLGSVFEGSPERIRALFEAAGSVREYVPAMRAMLGGGEDRLYIFAAQNSAEIRASGGFPGSVGLIRIRDGQLSISEFQSVYNVFAQATPAAAGLTAVENQLFSGRMNLSWDADFSPDFERVASIWALAYEARTGEHVNGVVSCTPAIVQRLLSFLGSVTLSDGTELNGENATRVLGHDLYFRYLGANQSYNAPLLVDALFAESAAKTLEQLMGQLRLSMFPNLLGFFQQSVTDRTMMVWLADEQEQALIRAAGWNAGIRTAPDEPKIGVYFNSTAASKIAWFLDIDTELGEAQRNDDGSLSYDLTVRFTNVITEEERRQASGYILGGTGGITGSLYIFAPTGGSVTALSASNGRQLGESVYEELPLLYQIDATVYADAPLEISCRVTTAPGVETVPGFIITPTMQDYR